MREHGAGLGSCRRLKVPAQMYIPARAARFFLSIAATIPLAAVAADAPPEPMLGRLPHVAPTEPGAALKTFQIKKGFRLELVAAEPLVADPIAMSFDENGRLFVVEMRDYP